MITKGLIASNKTLIEDVNKYNEAVMTDDISSFAEYAAGSYDISRDYWKVLKHKDGSLTMTDDGSDDVTVIDEESGAEKTVQLQRRQQNWFYCRYSRPGQG